MYKFQQISVSIMVIMVLLLIIHMYRVSIKPKDKRKADLLREIDINGDGIIQRSELKKYLQKTMTTMEKKEVSMNDLMRSMGLGITKGLLMGFVLGNLEGGLALAFILAVLNPIMIGVERSV